MPSKPDYDGQQVQLCADGKYHWTSPVNLYRNPTIFFTVCKIFGILGGIAFVALNIGPAFRGEFAAIGAELKYWGIAVAVFLVIALLAYLIVAGQYGGRYTVRFTLDAEKLVHEQIPEQAKKARKLGSVLAGVGALTGSPGRAGQGLMVASHTSLISDLSKVKSIKAFPRRCTIKLSEPFAHNQVYTTREDFDFVLNYLREHCPKAQ